MSGSTAKGSEDGGEDGGWSRRRGVGGEKVKRVKGEEEKEVEVEEKLTQGGSKVRLR